MFLPIVAILVFAVTLVLMMSLLWLFVETPLAKRRMMARLSAIQETAVRDPSSAELLRKEMLSDIPVLNQVLLNAPGIPQLRLFLEQAAVEMQVGTFVLIVVTLPLFMLLMSLLLGSSLLAALLLAGFAASLPFLIVAYLRRRRFNKFEEQFPEAMDLLGRAVRAGHAFTTGFELIGKELADPVGEEFRIAFQQQNLGLPLRDALANMTVRVPLPDVRVFVSALQIQRESGGNLAEVLDTLSSVVRDRFKLRRQIQTYTAEGRLASYVLSALPIVALIALQLVRPGYVTPLFTDPTGQAAIIGAVILQIVGYLVIRWIINIKV